MYATGNPSFTCRGCLGTILAPAGTPSERILEAREDRTRRQLHTFTWGAASMIGAGALLWGIDQYRAEGMGRRERTSPTAKALVIGAVGLATVAIVGWQFDSTMLERLRAELVAQGATSLPP